eukprot:3756445-Rhodomonas_salina.1
MAPCPAAAKNETTRVLSASSSPTLWPCTTSLTIALRFHRLIPISALFLASGINLCEAAMEGKAEAPALLLQIGDAIDFSRAQGWVPTVTDWCRNHGLGSSSCHHDAVDVSRRAAPQPPNLRQVPSRGLNGLGRRGGGGRTWLIVVVLAVLVLRVLMVLVVRVGILMMMVMIDAAAAAAAAAADTAAAATAAAAAADQAMIHLHTK